jgi:cytochrome c oxidase assembly factor CtaG
VRARRAGTAFTCGRERRGRGRCPAAAACLLLLCLIVPPVAGAHGGTPLVTRIAGDYRIQLQALAVPNGGGVGGVDYTVRLHARTSGALIADARVLITVQQPERTIGPVVAHWRAGAYETLIPIAGREQWLDSRVEIEIDSRARGRAGVSYRPPAPDFGWPWRQPLVLAAAALAIGLYLRACLRLRRRGRRDLASPGRLACFGGGVALALIALLSPIDPIGESYLQSVHMLQHMLLGDAAPALLVAGLRGPLIFFVMPAGLLRRVAPRRSIRRIGRTLLHPPVAIGLWAAIYGGWHIPAAYDAALASRTVHELEHATFFAAGLLVWMLLVDPVPRSGLTIRMRMGFAIVLFSVGTILSDVLLLTGRPIYPAYLAEPVRLWGISPLTDQRLAGMAMMIAQLASLTICIAFLVRAERRTRSLRRRDAAVAA